MSAPHTIPARERVIVALDVPDLARRSTAISADAARGDPGVLVSAMQSAPLRRADCSMATMSGLLPDCETASTAHRRSFSSRP